MTETGPTPDPSSLDTSAPDAAAAGTPSSASGPDPRAQDEGGPPTYAERLTGALTAKGLTPQLLVGLALGLTGISVLSLLVRHPGLAGVFAFLALATSALALVPDRRREIPVEPLANGASLVVDLALAAALVAECASQGRGLGLLLALIVLVLFAWLPHLRAAAPPGRLPARAGIWRRSERLAVLALAVLLGRSSYGLLLLVIVGGLDAVLRLDRLRTSAGQRWRPKFLDPLVAEDGTLEPVVRWGSLALAFLLLAVLPRAADWRF